MSKEKITIKSLIEKKDVLKEKKTSEKQLFVRSLDGYITVKKPPTDVILDSLAAEEGGNEYLVYQSVVEPNLKDSELHQAFGVVHDPEKIVYKIFETGEVLSIAETILDITGFNNSVALVDEVKNS